MVKEELLYTKEHEWVKVNGDCVVAGITDYAVKQLGDIVFVELPEVGKILEQYKPFGAVESVKAVSDLYAPVSGEVIEVNRQILDNPEYVSEDPYEKGWMVKIKISNKSEFGNLLKPSDYSKIIS